MSVVCQVGTRYSLSTPLLSAGQSLVGHIVLDALEQRSKISLTKASATSSLSSLRKRASLSLNNLDKYGWTVTKRLSEDLEQCSLSLSVNEDGQLFAFFNFFLGNLIAHLFWNDFRIIVSMWLPLEIESCPSLLHLANSLVNIIGQESQVLYSRSLIVLQVVLNLRNLFGSIRWLIEWKENHLVVIGAHYRVQSRLLSSNILGNKFSKFVESHHTVQVGIHWHCLFCISYTMINSSESIVDVWSLC
mmetsp:Transcript_1696/g.5954  ORF Transcript_1696/g.5954 Transcript_1696/m.5954 type:complete len:246 (-) Transcript_1696:704-1441(-)